jgi:hypothetical protein
VDIVESDHVDHNTHFTDQSLTPLPHEGWGVPDLLHEHWQTPNTLHEELWASEPLHEHWRTPDPPQEEFGAPDPLHSNAPFTAGRPSQPEPHLDSHLGSLDHSSNPGHDIPHGAAENARVDNTLEMLKPTMYEKEELRKRLFDKTDEPEVRFESFRDRVKRRQTVSGKVENALGEADVAINRFLREEKWFGKKGIVALGAVVTIGAFGYLRRAQPRQHGHEWHR